MIIVIDFDGVLFDDRKFKKEYIRIFADAGVTMREYEGAYRESKNAHGGSYHPDTHLLLLKKMHTDFSIALIKKKRAELVALSFRYVFKDAEPFLASQKKKGLSLYMLSTGMGFQKKKIKSSGLSRYFKKIKIIPDSSKGAAMLRLLRGLRKEHFIFIDDKKEIVEEIKRAFPRASVIQMARHKGERKSRGVDAVAKNFSEVARVIKKIWR